MKLGIILSPGDSLHKQNRSGQLERLKEYYLKPYSRQFDRIIIFSYQRQDTTLPLPAEVTVVPVYRLDLLNQVDVIRVFQAPGGIPGWVGKLLFRKRLVVTYGYDYFRFALIEGHRFLALSLWLLVNFVLFWADKVIVTDPQYLYWRRSSLIRNGVDCDKFKPGLIRRQNLVLSVGRLVKQKNFPALLQAVSVCPARTKLVIIGVGPEHDNLVRLAQSLKVNLTILEPLPYWQLITWYQQATIFALPSIIEGSPKALIEAMSCACACITADFPGNIINDGVSGLIGLNKIPGLLAHRQLRDKLGQQARQEVLKNYNIKKLIEAEIILLKNE